MALNRGQDDPIQNRALTDACWNSWHRESVPGCTGWLDNGNRCECLCHQAIKPKKKKAAPDSLHIVDDTGAGTIEIK